MIAFRLRHPAFLRPEFFTGHDGNYNAIPDITWFDEKGESPDWAKVDKRLALRLDGSKADTFADRDDNDFFIMFNASAEGTLFIIAPPMEGKKWFRSIDTSLESPEDIVESGGEVTLPTQGEYYVRERSVVVLLSKKI
jgi:glycogen operon protein